MSFRPILKCSDWQELKPPCATFCVPSDTQKSGQEVAKFLYELNMINMNQMGDIVPNKT